MSRKQTVAGNGAPAAADPVLAGVNAAVEELIEVIDAENRLLAGGMPASLTRSTVRKSSLAAMLSAALVGDGSRAVIAALPATERARLADRVDFARRLADENSARLEAAMRASRRRIAAVMAAMRDHARRESTGYGANGRRGSTTETGVMIGGRVV